MRLERSWWLVFQANSLSTGMLCSSHWGRAVWIWQAMQPACQGKLLCPAAALFLVADRAMLPFPRLLESKASRVELGLCQRRLVVRTQQIDYSG